MIHFLLLLVCILTIEIFIRLNFLSFLDSIFKVSKKVTHVIAQNKISDHWKERIIPAYALRIMKYSIQILMILLLVIFIFIVAGLFVDNFLALAISLNGVIESIVFAFGYTIIRKLLIK